MTKWSAIQRIAKAWGIDDEEICAVGDDVNDIPMIRAGAWAWRWAMPSPSVKAAADRIAPTHDQNGLVDVIEWILEGARD